MFHNSSFKSTGMLRECINEALMGNTSDSVWHDSEACMCWHVIIGNRLKALFLGHISTKH